VLFERTIPFEIVNALRSGLTMNKAFVREPEEKRDRCPSCGTAGVAVFEVTLKAWLSEEQRQQLSDAAYFCSRETCEVAYFDGFDRVVAADEMATPVWPKDPQASVCPCFNLTRADIQSDIDENSVAHVRETIQRAQSDEARCSTKSPSGQSCVAAVQKCYMRLRG
jgi:hypothetical protein